MKLDSFCEKVCAVKGILKSAELFPCRLPALLTIAALALLALVRAQFVVCPFRALTGMGCPACGLTRSVSSFFQLEFVKSFVYHPLGSFVALFLLMIALTNRMDFYRALSGRHFAPMKFALRTQVVVGIFLGVWFLRML